MTTFYSNRFTVVAQLDTIVKLEFGDVREHDSDLTHQATIAMTLANAMQLRDILWQLGEKANIPYPSVTVPQGKQN